jgi:hypothetical protein
MSIQVQVFVSAGFISPEEMPRCGIAEICTTFVFNYLCLTIGNHKSVSKFTAPFHITSCNSKGSLSSTSSPTRFFSDLL